MAFWSTALLVLVWRYIHEGRDRYLYLASAVLAFTFATKETAYFVVLIFGALMFLLALPDLVPLVSGRTRLAQLAGPAGAFILLVTLTLPQWSAFIGLFQGLLRNRRCTSLGWTFCDTTVISCPLVAAPTGRCCTGRWPALAYW
jgi:hypothetical protein